MGSYLAMAVVCAGLHVRENRRVSVIQRVAIVVLMDYGAFVAKRPTSFKFYKPTFERLDTLVEGYGFVDRTFAIKVALEVLLDKLDNDDEDLDLLSYMQRIHKQDREAKNDENHQDSPTRDGKRAKSTTKDRDRIRKSTSPTGKRRPRKSVKRKRG